MADTSRQWARRAVLGIVQEAGGRTTPPAVFRSQPDLDMTVTDAEPMAGMQAARHLALAARHLTLSYVRQAREDSRSWHEIGIALGLGRRDGDTSPSPAEAAYDSVADLATWGHSFAWTCPACRGTVLDRGPDAGHPFDAEPGHAEGCSRLAGAIAAWNASWEDEDDQ